MASGLFKNCATLAFAAGLAILGTAAPAKASLVVDYTTSVTTTSPLPTGVLFTGVSNGSVTLFDPLLGNNTYSGASFGRFDTTGITAGNVASLNGIALTLTVTQTLPAPTGGSPTSFSANLTGLITVSGSTASITFDQPLAQIITTDVGPITYSVPGDKIIIVANNTGGITTIQGTISAVPEPATMAMAFSALPLLGLAAWRSRRRPV